MSAENSNQPPQEEIEAAQAQQAEKSIQQQTEEDAAWTIHELTTEGHKSPGQIELEKDSSWNEHDLAQNKAKLEEEVGKATEENGLLFSKLGDSQAENERLMNELFTDQLTGMPNRNAYVAWLNEQIEGGSENVWTGFFDMDKLKELNDTYGHEFADQVIQEVGKRLTEIFSDIAARRSGDEFMAGIVGGDSETVQTQAEQALKSINSIGVTKDGRMVDMNEDPTASPVGVSMGFAKLESGMSAIQVMAAADANMYMAKRAGRNQYRLPEAKAA